MRMNAHMYECDMKHASCEMQVQVNIYAIVCICEHVGNMITCDMNCGIIARVIIYACDAYSIGQACKAIMT